MSLLSSSSSSTAPSSQRPSNAAWTLSASLFCVSAYWFWQKQQLQQRQRNRTCWDGRAGRDRLGSRTRQRRRRKRGDDKSNANGFQDDDDDCETDDDDEGGGAPALGARGRAAADRPAVPYLGQFLSCLENLCDPQSNPMGCIPLCVAENRLVLDMITRKFVQMTTAATSSAALTATNANGGSTAAENNEATANAAMTSSSPFADPSTYCYNSFLGMPVARDAAAYFIARHLLFGGGGGTYQTDSERIHGEGGDSANSDGDDTQHGDVSPDAALEAVQSRHVVLATGAAALLSHLFVLLGNSSPARRECCLIPAPYYAAFDNHCRLVPDVEPFGVVQTNPLLGPTDADLDRAYRQAQQKGLTPRFLLITNPNNPLGIVYPPATIRRLVDWGRARDMHIIVDEVYALSTHPHHPHAFQSVVKVLNNRLCHDVHLLYALSKDFGSSGLRVGMLYTQNDDLLDAMPSVNIYTCVPGPIQYLVAELLTDDPFVDSFLETSRNRLQYSYQICAQKLDEMVIPYVPAMAGVFVYVDFSALIPSRCKTEAGRREWETEFGRLVFRYARLVMTPGSVQHDPYPGMFRICYGWVSVEVLQIAMERLSRLVAKVRRLDWDDLNERTLSGVLDVGIY